jgi:GT2 family glycosyltransferase
VNPPAASNAPAPDTVRVPRVSIVIKCLNEERHIAAALQSALAAAEQTGGEVILADSGSTDGTIDIARRFPVTIVQLADFSERRCGVGPQLGYQAARGEFVYVLDGDMELEPGFLSAALLEMAREPSLAGVGGLVEECSSASYQFRGRKRRAAERVARDCRWLDMGGLYRVAALREVGFLSNRNLHSFEEMELGLRLGAAGWGLRRIAVPAVRHHGRTENSWVLLGRRWRTRYLDGSGELLRAALGTPGFLAAVRSQAHLLFALGLWIALVAAVALAPYSTGLLAATLAAVVLLVGVRALRGRSVADAVMGQVVWQVSALALVRGFFARRKDPLAPVAFRVLAHPGEGRGRRLAAPSDAT